MATPTPRKKTLAEIIRTERIVDERPARPGPWQPPLFFRDYERFPDYPWATYGRLPTDPEATP